MSTKNHVKYEQRAYARNVLDQSDTATLAWQDADAIDLQETKFVVISGTGKTVTFPDAASYMDGAVRYVLSSGGTNTLAFTAASGAETRTLTQGDVCKMVCDGDYWYADVEALAKRINVAAASGIYMDAQANDADTITINGRVYEFDPGDDGIAGDVEIDTNGNANIDDDIDDAVAAINGDGSAEVTAVADTANDIIWIYAGTAGTAGNSLTLAESTSEARMKVMDSTLADGFDEAVGVCHTIKHTVTANEASIGALAVHHGLTSIESLSVQALDGGAGGDLTTPDVSVTDSGGVLILGEGSSPSWATGDIFYVTIIGTA